MKKNRWMIYVLLTALICCVGCGKKEKDETETTTQTEVAPVVDSPATQTEAEKLPEMDAEGYYIVNDSVEVSVELADIRVRAEADADIYMLAEQGTVLNRTGYNDMWTRVELQNTSFYVLSDTVAEIAQPVADTATMPDTATQNDAPRVKKVVIDPGNQAASSLSTEAIGPGSEVTKACASAGTVGSTFGTKESELNLEYAMSLKTELESRGYEVVLTRESDDVDLSNQARANIANSAGASAFIRIEMSESSNAALDGVMAVCMTANTPYNSDLYNDSRALATRLLQGITETMDVTNRGIYETDEMTAINWSDIPVAEIHLGFLTNATDEANLATDTYKEQLITGLANGIDYFMQ